MSISHVKYQFFPAGTTFTQLLVWWLHHLLCYGEYTYDSKLKKFREMFLTTLTHNQHDINDFIWTLPVWNLKIKRYLALCMLQFWSNLTKTSFEGKHLIIFVHCCKYDMQDFTFSKWQTLPAEPLSIIARRFTRVEWNIQMK